MNANVESYLGINVTELESFNAGVPINLPGNSAGIH